MHRRRRRACPAAVRIVEQRTGGRIVDDEVVGVPGGRANDERLLPQSARGEHRERLARIASEQDPVGAGLEVLDDVDVAIAERGGEREAVGAAEADQPVGAEAAV